MPNAALAQSQASESNWVRSEPSGCLLYINPPPLHEHKASWTGACVNGKAEGQGKLSFRTIEGDLQTYAGGVKAGRQHGRGVFTAKEATMDGDWVDDAFTGIGRIQDTQCLTVGRFVNGKGQGSMRRDCPGMFSYHGEMRSDMRHGFGVLSLPIDKQAEAVASFEQTQSGRRVGKDYVVSGFWENDELRFACASAPACQQLADNDNKRQAKELATRPAAERRMHLQLSRDSGSTMPADGEPYKWMRKDGSLITQGRADKAGRAFVEPVKTEHEYQFEAFSVLSEYSIDAACWQRLPEQFARCATLNKRTSLIAREIHESAKARRLEAKREHEALVAAYQQEVAEPPAQAWQWLEPLPKTWNEDAYAARQDAFSQGLMHDLQTLNVDKEANPQKFQCPAPVSFGAIPDQEAVLGYVTSPSKTSERGAALFNPLLAAAAKGNWMARVQVYNHLRKQADESLAARYRALQVGEWLRQHRLGPVYSILLRDLAESDYFNGPPGGVLPASVYAAMRGSYSTMDEVGQKLKRSSNKELQTAGARMIECARKEMPAFFR